MKLFLKNLFDRLFGKESEEVIESKVKVEQDMPSVVPIVVELQEEEEIAVEKPVVAVDLVSKVTAKEIKAKSKKTKTEPEETKKETKSKPSKKK